MKKLLFVLSAVNVLFAFGKTVSIELEKGITSPPVSGDVMKLERIEAFAATAGATVSVKRVRGLVDIPYLSHFTNDGAAVGWKITDGTTFDRIAECFSGPIELAAGGGLSSDWASSPYQQVDSEKITFAGYGAVTDSQGRSGYSPKVLYYFAANGLCEASPSGDGSPGSAVPLGYPNRFRYGTGYFPRRSDWSFCYGPHLLERVVTNSVPERVVSGSSASNVVESSAVWLDMSYEDTSAFFARYGYDFDDLMFEETNRLVVRVTCSRPTCAVTNRVSSLEWALPAGSELRTALDSMYPGLVPCTNLSVRTSCSADFSSVVTNTYLTSADPSGGGYVGTAPAAFLETVVTSVVKTVVSDSSVYGVSDVLTYFLSDYPSDSRWGSTVFRDVAAMPTGIVYSATGEVRPARFDSGHVVTNFAVWSTFSTQATNSLWEARPAKGSISSKDLGSSGYLLPNDRIVTEGTVLPTGQVRLYLDDGK